MLAVYSTLSSKKRNVLVDPNKYELTTYNQCQETNIIILELCVENKTFKMCSNSRCKVKLLLGKLRILLHGKIGVGEISDWGS